MTDMLLELSQSAVARNLVARAKLPIPLPERLQRAHGPSVEQPLFDQRVVVGGAGACTDALAHTLCRAGAEPLLLSPSLAQAFAGPGEAYGRHARVVSEPAGERAHALICDASALARSADLRLLYDTFHPWLGALAHHGRCLIVGRPPELAGDAEQAAAQAALHGFVRALAKEIGGKAATANLITVQPGAEPRLSAALRFCLSKASAFVSGQVLDVSSSARFQGDDPWTAPLSGRTALVTGAARGIGEATARLLAEEGAHVVCLDRPDDADALSQVARDCGGEPLSCDVRDAEAPERIAAFLLEQRGGVDIVVHNAGVTRDRTLARMDEGRWDAALEINLEAVLRITARLRDGVLRDDGRIVSLSSIAGIAGNNGQTNYSASKAGVIGLTRQLARELAPRGITVNAVAPGFIETRMTAAVPAVVRQAGRRLSALGQGGLPEDVARAIAFFASPGAAGVTGNVLRVCGGALIGA